MLNEDLLDGDIELRKKIFRLEKCIADFKEYDKKRKKEVNNLIEQHSREIIDRDDEIIKLKDELEFYKKYEHTSPQRLRQMIRSLKGEIERYRLLDAQLHCVANPEIFEYVKNLKEYNVVIKNLDLKQTIQNLQTSLDLKQHKILQYFDQVAALKKKIEQLQTDNRDLCYKLLHA